MLCLLDGSDTLAQTKQQADGWFYDRNNILGVSVHIYTWLFHCNLLGVLTSYDYFIFETLTKPFCSRQHSYYKYNQDSCCNHSKRVCGSPKRRCDNPIYVC